MTSPRMKGKSGYDVHPSVIMIQEVIAGMKEKTGRTLEQWVKLARTEGPGDERKRREWLKARHGLGTNYARWVAERSFGKGEDGDPNSYLAVAGRYVAKLFSAPKLVLVPIYDALLKLGRRLGADVRVCPCQTVVPFYRNHVFAQIRRRPPGRASILAWRSKTPKRQEG